MVNINRFVGFFLFYSFFYFFVLFLLLNPFFFVDKMSFLMISLSIVLSFIVFLCLKMLIYLYNSNGKVSLVFYFTMIILGFCFYSSNMFTFYVFFELSVLPIFFYMLGWGASESKIVASYYLFFFTFFSSILFLLFMFFVFFEFGTLNFFLMFFVDYFFDKMLFYVFILVVFFVSMPIFIFHIWLPLAHVESPMLGSMVLAGLMLSLGGYGIVRMSFIFLSSFSLLKMYFYNWGMWGGILAAFFCIFQTDLSKLVAYSSVSHMSLIMMSIFSFKEEGVWGILGIMLSHGLLSSFMFFGLGVFYYRFMTRNLYFLYGISLCMPLMGFWWAVGCSLSLGFPPFIGFFSELFLFFSLVMNMEMYFILGVLFFVISTYYVVSVMVYVVGNVSKGDVISMEIFLIEHLIFFVHLFYLLFSVMLFWFV